MTLRAPQLDFDPCDELAALCKAGGDPLRLNVLRTLSNDSFGVLELAQIRMAKSMSSMLHQQPLSVESLCQAALQGDLLARDIISGVGNHVGRILAIMVNLFNPQKILIGSPFNLAADILFPAISDCIRQQSLPAYSRHIAVESTQFSNRGTMAGAALVKDALYNGSLLIRLLQG